MGIYKSFILCIISKFDDKSSIFILISNDANKAFLLEFVKMFKRNILSKINR